MRTCHHYHSLVLNQQLFVFFKMFYITVSRLCGTLMCFYLQHIFLQLCCHILDHRD